MLIFYEKEQERVWICGWGGKENLGGVGGGEFVFRKYYMKTNLLSITRKEFPKRLDSY